METDPWSPARWFTCHSNISQRSLRICFSERSIELLSLNCFHHAHHVAAENLVDVGFRVAASQQLAREVRQLRNISQVTQSRLHPIEVRSDSNVINAHQFHNVIDVIDQSRNSNWW